ncbi:MAG: tripartite tricarboxylate transporter substrate binding protein [Pseudomonadota bacterium]|nr:tripartite tricarboxylate transporter substrate binding protein [Pseudomonadota bacterium]
MSISRRTLVKAAPAFAGGLAFSGWLHAQEAYPNPARSIRIIVPFSPATGIDILARTLGQKLGEKWKLAVVVDNRVGASGNIGTEAAAKSPPDGYTLLMTANTIVLNRSLFKKIPYDPIKDFAPIAPLAIASMALVAHPSLNAKTAADLIRLAKASPGKINYGSPGNGTPHHLAMELFKHQAGIEMTHVPYRGTGPAVTDLLGGQIGVMFLPVHVALPHLQGGKLNILAAGSRQRTPVTPEIPSLAEATGVKNIDVDIWYAVYAPAGTPADIVMRLNAEMNALLKQPEVRETLGKQGLAATGGSPEQLAQMTRDDMERWAKVVQAAKIEAD